MRAHKMGADYPLAGSDDGLPVVITFGYTPGSRGRRTLNNGDPGYPGWPPEVELQRVDVPAGVPERIQQAIWCWARDYLIDGEGYDRALDAVDDAEDKARELAAELRADR